MLAALARPHVLLACVTATTLALGAVIAVGSIPASEHAVVHVEPPARIVRRPEPVALPSPFVTTASGLAFTDTLVGAGRSPVAGQTVLVA